MEKSLSIVEKQPSIEIIEGRLRHFLSYGKVWDFIKISPQEYQSLPATERYSILKDYYAQMCKKYGSDIKLFCFYCFCTLFGFLLAFGFLDIMFSLYICY